MMEYVMLGIGVLAAIGVGLVYLVAKSAGFCGSDCTGDCNQGRNCDCKGKE